MIALVFRSINPVKKSENIAAFKYLLTVLKCDTKKNNYVVYFADFQGNKEILIDHFKKFDNQVYGYDISDDNFDNKIGSPKIIQTNYKKNDLKNFNQIIQNHEKNNKSSVKIVNLYERKNSNSKKENINLKKIKILFFD